MHTTPGHLTGRAAIVAGAGRGRGAAAAHALAGAGVQVAVCDLNPDRAERVAGEIIASGGQAFGWQADVSNRFQVAGLIETTRDRFGRLDIFVQAARVSPRVPALTMDEWEFRRTLEVNLTGSFFCAQLAARVMADEGGGLIVLLAEPPSGGGGAAAYRATQAGLSALGEALAEEWHASRVRVEVVAVESPTACADAVLSLARDYFQ